MSQERLSERPRQQEIATQGQIQCVWEALLTLAKDEIEERINLRRRQSGWLGRLFKSPYEYIGVDIGLNISDSVNQARLDVRLRSEKPSGLVLVFLREQGEEVFPSNHPLMYAGSIHLEDSNKRKRGRRGRGILAEVFYERNETGETIPPTGRMPTRPDEIEVRLLTGIQSTALLDILRQSDDII